MCDGHFARIFVNFKDFPGELLVFNDFLGGEVKFQEFSRSLETLKLV